MVNSWSNINHNFLCKIKKIISADALPLILQLICQTILNTTEMRKVQPPDFLPQTFFLKITLFIIFRKMILVKAQSLKR